MKTELKRILEEVGYHPCENQSGISKCEIEDICFDSRKAGTGSLFFCLKGYKTDGHLYAPDAYDRGCRAFVTERILDLPDDAVQISVDNSRSFLSAVSDAFYGYPSKKIKLIGITGTKGKTSTSIYIREVLSRSGLKCGYIGTLGVITDDETFSTNNSTPESCDINRYLSSMIEKGYSHCVIEVSSQALKYYRVDDMDFDTVAFTNLYPDHISPAEHPDFDDYAASKKKLFTMFSPRFVIVNSDDPFTEYMLEDTDRSSCQIIRYGIDNYSDYSASSVCSFIEDSTLGVDFKVHHLGEDYDFRLMSPGVFSAYNALCAAAVCGCYGVSCEALSKIICNVTIPGRFETVKTSLPVIFILDYAHNGISLTKALSLLKSYNPKRLICVFGSIGGRAFDRRQDLAKAASEYADLSIITSDNPDFEDPQAILLEIEKHFDLRKEHVLIPDRSEAVRFAVKNSEKGDIVLFAGKGHEDYQIIQGKKIPFSERSIIESEANIITKDIGEA